MLALAQSGVQKQSWPSVTMSVTIKQNNKAEVMACFNANSGDSGMPHIPIMS